MVGRRFGFVFVFASTNCVYNGFCCSLLLVVYCLRVFNIAFALAYLHKYVCIDPYVPGLKYI